MTSSPNSMMAEFLHYNCWANLRLIEACSALTPAQLASASPGAYGSISDTLKHIVRAESRYYKRLTGILLDPPASWEAGPSLAELRAYAEQTGRALAETAERMQATDVIQRDWEDAGWEGRPARYQALSILIQVINHGVEHRTNITTILAQQGLPAPALDGWEYMRLNADRLGA